jgi:antitoxin component YwqK of YwqJK toxin-antitoxin module
MKTLSLSFLLFGLLLLYSNEYVIASAAQPKSLYSQLCELNSEWKKMNPPAVLLEPCTFSSDKELIQKHLLLVEQYLRAKQTTGLTKEQKTQRERNLDVLHAYAVAGIFPENSFHTQKRTPYFIDIHGNACAVGYLIIQSGNVDLAQRISIENNYAYLKDIKTEGLSDWQFRSGLSPDELAWIQPSYEFKYREPPSINGIRTYQKPNPHCGNDSIKVDSIISSGTCINGKLEGKWILRLGHRVWEEGNFVAGEKEGRWYLLEPYSGRYTFSHYHKGKLDGSFRQYNTSGKLVYKADYAMGRRYGKVITWSDQGEMTSLTTYFKAGKSTVTYYTHDQHGRYVYKGIYLNDIMNGPYRVYSPDPKGNTVLTTIVNYKMGKAEGLSTSVNFYNGSSGYPQKEVGYFCNGSKCGIFKVSLYQIKKKDTVLAYRMEENYVKGRLEGESRTWYTNGRLYRLCHYRNDTLNGEFLEWDSSGRVSKKMWFKKGMPEGIALEYQGRDHSMTRTLFHQNQVIWRKTYNPDKVLTSELYAEPEHIYCLKLFNSADRQRQEGFISVLDLAQPASHKFGTWYVSDRQGNLIRKENYENGKLSDPALK